MMGLGLGCLVGIRMWIWEIFGIRNNSKWMMESMIYE